MSDRLRRLLLLVPAARARPGITLSELSKGLDCTPEELRQDIELLSGVGIPPFNPDDLIEIELRGERVFVSLPQGFDRPTRLSWTEGAALAIATQSLAPADPVAHSAIEKLERSVPDDQRALYAALVRGGPAETPESTVEIERAINQSAHERRVLEMTYFAKSDPVPRTRKVKPRAIATTSGLKYLSAQNENGDERWYRLDRIFRASLTDQRFDPLSQIDLAAAASRLGTFDGPEWPTATVRFESRVAAAASARHPEARKLADGSVEADIPYSTLPWIVSYALSWGGNAVIVAPPEARAAMLKSVEAALADLRE